MARIQEKPNYIYFFSHLLCLIHLFWYLRRWMTPKSSRWMPWKEDGTCNISIGSGLQFKSRPATLRKVVSRITQENSLALAFEEKSVSLVGSRMRVGLMWVSLRFMVVALESLVRRARLAVVFIWYQFAKLQCPTNRFPRNN